MKNKSTLNIILISVVLLFLQNNSILAQGNVNNSIQPVKEVASFIETLKVSELNSGKTIPNSERLESLLYNLQSSIYVNSGVVKVYGEKPTNLFVDIQSLNGLNNSKILKNNIEIIIIKIKNSNELNATIDLNLFSSYKKLKYIYILSNTSATENSMARMIRNNTDDKYGIFYKVDLEEGN